MHGSWNTLHYLIGESIIKEVLVKTIGDYSKDIRMRIHCEKLKSFYFAMLMSKGI